MSICIYKKMDKIHFSSGSSIHQKSIKGIQNSINSQKPDLTHRRLPHPVKK